jgi:hypothetical protein
LLDADGKPITASVPFVIGGGGGGGGGSTVISGIDAGKAEVNASGVRGRVFWYINTEQPE